MVQLTQDEVLDLLRARLSETGEAKLAEEIGVSRTLLNKIKRGERTPSAKVLKFLGIERLTVYAYRDDPARMEGK